jgi:hypothetical protein
MATIVSGGDYKIELSSGFDSSAFYLDDSTLDGTDVLDGDGDDFNDITTFCDSIQVQRGRKQTLDEFGAGTMQVSMFQVNTASTLSPFNTASTYYNTTTEQPGLAPLRPIRLSRNGVYLFQGKVTSYNVRYVLGGNTLYDIQCADDIYTLAQTALTTTATTSQTSSARFSAILDDSAVAYSATNRNITATPTATLGAFTIDDGTNVFTYIQRINNAEQGRVFVAANTNYLTFQPRIGTTLAASSATFTDTGLSVPFNGIGIQFDQQSVINSAAVTIESGGTVQTATDSDSIDEYFTQRTIIIDSLLSTNAQAATLADYLLDPIPQPRFNSLSTAFNMLSDAQKTTLAALEIGDTITITKSFAASTPSTITQNLSIEGIDHTITVGQGHSITFYTSQTIVFTTLILDDITFGIINSTNSLG